MVSIYTHNVINKIKQFNENSLFLIYYMLKKISNIYCRYLLFKIEIYIY